MIAIQRGDAGHGNQCHATRAKRSMNVRDRRRHVENQVQSLSQDDAVEVGGWKRSGIGEVADDRRARVARVQIQYVLSSNTITPEPAGIMIFLHFEHMAFHVRRMPLEESFNVIAVDRCAAIFTPDVAERFRRAYPADVHCEQAEWPSGGLGNEFKGLGKPPQQLPNFTQTLSPRA